MSVTARPGYCSGLEDIPALIMCGGLGTRIREVSGDALPKALLQVGPWSLLEHTLRVLYASGIRRAVLCISHQAQRIKDYVRVARLPAIQVLYSETAKPIGVSGSMAIACREHGITTEFLLAGADEICQDLDLLEARRFHERTGALATMILTRTVAPEYASINAELDSKGRIVRLERNSPAGIPATGLIFINPAFLNLCSTQICDVDGTLLFRYVVPKLIGEQRLFGIVSKMTNYMHIGTPVAYHKACRFFEEHREAATGTRGDAKCSFSGLQTGEELPACDPKSEN